MTDTARYVSDQQQRLLRLILFLAGNELNGVRPLQIAKGLGVSASHVTRDMANLRHFGWLEDVPGAVGCVRLSPAIVQIAMRHMTGVERARSRLADLDRYSRS